MPAPLPDDGLDELGRLIRGAREARGWNQAELARRIGTSQPQISDLESGRVGLRALLTLRLSEVFGIPVPELVEAAARRGRSSESAVIVPPST